MALTAHIEDLIFAYKQMPNGKERNKVISKLEDAFAWATVLERNDPTYKSPEDVASLFASGNVINADKKIDTNSICICKPGMRNRSCVALVHVS